MIDEATKRAIAGALDRLSERIRAPRALAIPPAERASLEATVERARGQWLGPSEPVLTVALAGGTGGGKSTLINALAGSVIAEASEIRPTTRHIQVYHHRDDSLGSLTRELASEAAFVAHDRPELRHKMLVDAPDLDSFVVKHRATTRALLKRSGLIIYVFSPERYLEERTWSVLRQETEYSAAAAVLNKVDRLGSPDELEQITDDLRARFAAMGHGDIRIFRLCALAHVADGNGVLPALSPAVDDMVALRAFIERELQGSEIARLLRAQREGVVAHLRAEVDRVAPADLLARVDQVAEGARTRAEQGASRLSEAIAEPLGAVESELVPLLNLRRHERFWGPFRLWLALSDFVAFGLTSLVRRFLGRQPGDRTTLIERTLERGSRGAVENALRGVARQVQDQVYAAGLPLEPWRAVTARVDSAEFIAEVAREIEAAFDVSAVRFSDRGRTVVWLASTLGGLFPAAFVLGGLVVMTRDLFAGTYAGLPLLWHLLAMAVLVFLALQGLVSVFLPGGTRWFGPPLGPHSVGRAMARAVAGWIAAYRAELEADIADLREPLAVLEQANASQAAASSAV